MFYVICSLFFYCRFCEDPRKTCTHFVEADPNKEYLLKMSYLLFIHLKVLGCIYIPLVTQSVIPFNSTENSFMSWDWNYLSSENRNTWMVFFMCRNQASSSLNFACKITVLFFLSFFFFYYNYPNIVTLRRKGNILHWCNCELVYNCFCIIQSLLCFFIFISSTTAGVKDRTVIQS